MRGVAELRGARVREPAAHRGGVVSLCYTAGPMSGWSIDLGTTHTRVARWDDATGQPRLLEMPRICRKPGGSGDPLEGSRLIPSATQVLGARDLWTRIGAWPAVSRRFFWGKQAIIGRPALEENESFVSPAFAPSFKLFLEREALRPLVRAGSQSYTARDVARMFTRELLAEVQHVTGERIRDVALTAPVEAFETYRAELQQIAKLLGIQKVKFVDEPIAAATGYGLSLTSDRLVLLVDFGGGTLHVALAQMSRESLDAGHSRVIAKSGRPVGGTFVDRWLLAELGRRLGVPLEREPDDPARRARYKLMLQESRRVKEALFFAPTASFTVLPEELASLGSASRELLSKLDFTRDDLVEVLRVRGVYGLLDDCVESVLQQASQMGITQNAIQDVLMVGGSTLLPGIFPRIESRFGRDRVRSWQPFEAVAFGACVFAAGRANLSDHIVHDYAFVTYDAKTREPQYTVIVPRGTRFPTSREHWKRQLVPTCALGEPETMFKLIICEVGQSHGATEFVWDAQGHVHRVGAESPTGPQVESKVIVPLNESDPTLGYLDPPHPPSDRRPRLEIAFGVNDDRWLIATVRDLLSRKLLLDGHPVVRLL